jgi:hypothetical protein
MSQDDNLANPWQKSISEFGHFLVWIGTRHTHRLYIICIS